MCLATPRAIGALILREISTTYGRSPGGYIWAVLEPAAGIALLTLVFSIGFRTPPLGASFALYYAAGILPLMMFTELSGKLAQTIQFSRALLVYPRVTFLDALIARDGAAAEAAMRQHMERAQLTRLRMLRHTNPQTDPQTPSE